MMQLAVVLDERAKQTQNPREKTDTRLREAVMEIAEDAARAPEQYLKDSIVPAGGE